MQQLNRQDIIRIIEGKGAAERVPLLYDLWIYENMFDDDCQKRQDWLAQYPCDVDHKFLQFPGTTEGWKEDPSFFWAPPGVKSTEGKGLDSQFLIADWEDEETVEAFYATFPDPESPALITEEKVKDGRYLLGRWWDCLFERLWRLRGNGKCPYGFLSVSGTDTSSVCQTDKILYESDGTCEGGLGCGRLFCVG